MNLVEDANNFPVVLSDHDVLIVSNLNAQVLELLDDFHAHNLAGLFQVWFAIGEGGQNFSLLEVDLETKGVLDLFEFAECSDTILRCACVLIRSANHSNIVSEGQNLASFLHQFEDF